MLASAHHWNARPACALPVPYGSDTATTGGTTGVHKLVVGRWAITIAECGDDMLRLAIASLAEDDPVKLATLSDQDASTVTVLAANSTWRSPASANKRKLSCLKGQREEEEQRANAKRCRVEREVAQEGAGAARQGVSLPREATTEKSATELPCQLEEEESRTETSRDVAASFSCLPDEVKLHVFAMLPPMALLRAVPLVSREWCSLAHDEALWRVLYSRHIGGLAPSTTPQPSLYEPSPVVPTRRHNFRRPTATLAKAATTSTPESTSPSWRGTTSSVLQHLKSAFAELRRSLNDLAERQRRESEASTTRWLAHTVEWMVEGGHAPLLATFLRDVARFAPGGVIRSALADRRFLLGAAKSGHVGAVTTLVAFGADLGQAMVLATMNRDGAGVASLFRAYSHIKAILRVEYRRQQSVVAASLRSNHGRRLFGLVASLRDAMRTCMNLASVARDRELLELLSNLCATDIDLREAHEFANFIQFEGPLSSRRRHSQIYDEDDNDDDEEDDDDESEDDFEAEEGEDSDDEVNQL